MRLGKLGRLGRYGGEVVRWGTYAISTILLSTILSTIFSTVLSTILWSSIFRMWLLPLLLFFTFRRSYASVYRFIFEVVWLWNWDHLISLHFPFFSIFPFFFFSSSYSVVIIFFKIHMPLPFQPAPAIPACPCISIFNFLLFYTVYTK